MEKLYSKIRGVLGESEKIFIFHSFGVIKYYDVPVIVKDQDGNLHTISFTPSELTAMWNG